MVSPVTFNNKALTLLLIDNDELIQDCLSELLAADGHEVLAASSDDECMAMFIDSIRPDIIITNYRSQDFYGIEIVKTIRDNLGEEIPAIIYSDDESEKARDDIRENNCIFLRRPKLAHVLSKQVKKVYG